MRCSAFHGVERRAGACGPTIIGPKQAGQKEQPAQPQLSKAERKKLQKVQACGAARKRRVATLTATFSSRTLPLMPRPTCTSLSASASAQRRALQPQAATEPLLRPPPRPAAQEAKAAREVRATLLADLAANSLTSQQQALLQSSSKLGQRETLR